MATNKTDEVSDDNSKKLVAQQRTYAIIVNEILLPADELIHFKEALEKLRKAFMKDFDISDEDIIKARKDFGQEV